MTDLRIVPQPYEDLAAFCSIAPYLNGGWTAFTANEALARTEGNGVVYAIRLNGSEATSWTLTTQLPNDLLPIGNPFMFAFLDGMPAAVKIQNRAIIIPPEHRGSTYPTDVYITTSVMPRRAF